MKSEDQQRAFSTYALIVSRLALRADTWRKPLTYVGVAVTIAYRLIAASNLLNIQLFIAIVAGIGLILLAPIWSIWLGLRLRKAG